MPTRADLLLTTRRALSLGVIATLLVLLPASWASGALPEGPRAFVDTTYAPPAGAVHTLQAGDDLQAALDAAAPGDTIVLPAGETFMGNFVLRAKPGADWIYIRSSALASLPSPGGRVGPAHAGAMPKIVSPNTQPAVASELGAHHYRFVGLEITTTHATRDATQANLILFGFDVDGNAAATEDQLPHHITFDRCYIHGTPTGNVLRGLAANGASMAVVDSYLSDFHTEGSDSQAIAAWNGSGPFKIVNNYLEGAAENVLFGGADPTIAQLVPSDIEIRGNYFFKPLTWYPLDPDFAGITWQVKNLLELKNAQRVHIEGNVFQNVWPAAQAGFGVLFTVRNEQGTAPWSVVQDVAYIRNMMVDTAGGINILGTDNNQPSQRTQRVLIRDNLFDRIVDPTPDADPNRRLFQITSGVVDLTIDHNTAFQIGPIIVADTINDVPSSGFVFTNNIVPQFQGVTGAGTAAGVETLETFFPGYVYAGNVQAGGDPNSYPPGNFFPPTLADVGFVDLDNGDYRLAATSLFKNAGTDGKDPGADFALLAAATADAVDGTPPPAPTGIPFSIKSPDAGESVHGTIHVRAGPWHPSIKRVRFDVDGIDLGVQYWPPYVVKWNTRLLANGPHTLTAVALDKAGVVLATASAAVVVDNPDPTVRITHPKDGAHVKGTIHVHAAVTHAASIANLQFLLDGQDYGPLLTKPHHFGVRWETFLLENRAYTWTAIVTTLAGATIVSDPVTVTVANPAPTVRISHPKDGADVKGVIHIHAALTHRDRITSLQFKLNGQDYGPRFTKTWGHSVTWDTRLLPNAPNTWTAVITTVLGETIVSDPVTVMVANPVPTVRITKPKPGTVKGEIDIVAAVTHRDRITTLQFQIDDQDFGPAITTGPLSVDWNTLAAPDGPHTVRAVITTVLGDTIVSDPVAVVVSNPLPTVKIDSPKNGDTVKGKVTVKASVTERQRVASLQFQVDGKNLGAAITGNNYHVHWDADASGPGAHTLTAIITTTTGETITAPAVTVTVVKKK